MFTQRFRSAIAAYNQGKFEFVLIGVLCSLETSRGVHNGFPSSACYPSPFEQRITVRIMPRPAFTWCWLTRDHRECHTFPGAGFITSCRGPRQRYRPIGEETHPPLALPSLSGIHHMPRPHARNLDSPRHRSSRARHSYQPRRRGFS